MKSYRIPDTDGNSRLTKNLKFNYRKYRTMLHCIYANKEFYTMFDKEVVACNDTVVKECGTLVSKSMRLKFNSADWRKTWIDIAKDNVFIFHCKEMLDAPDIVEYLNGILPCGITRGMQVIMLFGESLKKCHDDLIKELNTENSTETTQEKFNYLEKWLRHLEKKGPQNFIVPKIIFEHAQKYAMEESPNFADVINSLIPTYRGCHLFMPYVWAAIMEQFRETDIQLPVYKPLNALAPKKDDLDLESSEESDAPNKTDEEEKLIQESKIIPKKITEKEKRMKRKRKNSNKLSGNIHSPRKISDNSKQVHDVFGQYAAETPQAKISIPLISGMIVEGFEFKVRVKSFHVKYDPGFEIPRPNEDAPWNPHYHPSPDTENTNIQHRNDNNYPYARTDTEIRSVAATSSNEYSSTRPCSNRVMEIRASDLMSREVEKILHKKVNSEDQCEY